MARLLSTRVEASLAEEFRSIASEKKISESELVRTYISQGMERDREIRERLASIERGYFQAKAGCEIVDNDTFIEDLHSEIANGFSE